MILNVGLFLFFQWSVHGRSGEGLSKMADSKNQNMVLGKNSNQKQSGLRKLHGKKSVCLWRIKDGSAS